jgi:hypothetical protein
MQASSFAARMAVLAQNGMKVRKKRDSQPMTWAESMKPLALYSMRASATCVEVTVLAA